MGARAPAALRDETHREGWEADGLGVDCSLHVLTFLDPLELAKVALVSHRFHALTRTPALWKGLCERSKWGCLIQDPQMTSSPTPYASWMEMFRHLAGMRWS